MPRNPGELDIHLRMHHIQRTKSSRAKLHTPLKQLGARGAVSKPLAANSQPVIVKVDTPGANARGIQPGYLQHGKGRDHTDAPLYGPGAGDPGRFGSSGGSRAAALEEVAQEDGVDLLLGVGVERLSEPLGVPLDVADDENGARHDAQDKAGAETLALQWRNP